MTEHKRTKIAALLVVPLLATAGPSPASIQHFESLPAASESSPLTLEPRGAMVGSISGRLAAGETVHVNMVVVLADFSDQPADHDAHPASYYETLFFSRGVVPGGSLAEYYLENSGGRFVLDGTVTGWYRMPSRAVDYTRSQFGLGSFPGNSQGLARDAIQAADRDVNYALFDNDGPDGRADTIDDDQKVDLVMIVHAGAGGETSASPNTFRSIAWWLPANLPVDGVTVFAFALGPELGGIGIFAHEMGHLLGLVDLYDLNGGSYGLGVWSLMSAGWSLGATTTPSHMDAWSKALIGFAPVIDVAGTMNDVVIDPIETGGSIYRLPAAGQEYFLVENRRKTGFDAAIPGGGLLIYHVDLRQANNNNPGSYRVALEQADGLFELERLNGAASTGDAGDPWDENSPSGGFGRYTTPSSVTNAGEQTGVTVYNIRGPDAEGRITVDFRTEKGPIVAFSSSAAAPADGNGDRFIDPGETFALHPVLAVDGGTAHDVRVELRSDDPLVEITAGSLALGDLEPGLHELEGLTARASAQIATDPYDPPFHLLVDYRDEVRFDRSFNVPVGRIEGLNADFENGDDGFTTEVVRPTKFTMWHRHDDPGDGSASAWRSADPAGGFRDRVDGALVTPYFIIPPNGRLIFDHEVKIPRDANNALVAGGFIEISLNGGPWTSIEPREGYDLLYFSTDAALSGRRVFSGTSQGWRHGTLDLSSFSGGARVRFRFFSERIVSTGTGWTIDNVSVQSGETPVLLDAFSAEREAGGVRVSWSLTSDEILGGLDLFRDDGDGAFVPVRRAISATERGEILDTAAPDGATAYRLAALRRDGTSLDLGTTAVSGAVASRAPRFGIAPNPVRSGASLRFTLPRPGETRLELFDPGGRRVRDLPMGVLAAGDHEIAWNGTDDLGRRIGAGVYFYRLTAPGVAITRKVVVAR